MVTVVTNLVYPYLVRADEINMDYIIRCLSDVVSVVSAAAMAAFFAAKFIIQLWIPKYNDSIPIVAIFVWNYSIQNFNNVGMWKLF